MENLAGSRFHDLLPPNLRNPISKALSTALDKQISKLAEHIKYTLIFADTANLSETMCDAVANSFEIEGYTANLDLSVKRKLIQSMFLITSTRGTTRAVNQAISIFYGGAEVVEHYGTAFHFKVIVDLFDSGVTNEQHREMARRIEFYKNIRSHLDVVDYRISAEGIVHVGMDSKFGAILTINPYRPDPIESFGFVNVGGNIRCAHIITIREQE